MGALGVRRVYDELKEIGFEPIELERYGSSNKIWMTKVKRLRLPDLLCVKTGMRAEVRAKSDLKIRMSDAPANPERVWDAGLRDQDVVALIACNEGLDGPIPAENGVYFSVDALRRSVEHSRLGPPKSASEGAERDRTWPATIPSRSGTVQSVDKERLVVMMEGDGNPARKQTYALKGKHVYVSPGDKFEAGISILAGFPESLANLDGHLSKRYDPLKDVFSESALDRYAAAKALRFREDLHPQSVARLESLVDTEQDARVLLEASGSAAALGSNKGEERIGQVLWDEERNDLRMEAIFILTELGNRFAKEQLLEVAKSPALKGDERRQAAIWGLGKTGLKSYADLIPFLADDEENVVFHAIAAFGPDASDNVIEQLIESLISGDERRAAGASEALRVIGSRLVLVPT